MISQKTLKLYVYVDGVHDVPFYGSDAGEYEEFIVLNGEQFVTSNGFVFNVRNVNEQIEIGSFRYDAKRMGGAPTISFTLMYEDCLDGFWSDGVYAVFNGEKYFLKQTPTSSLSNEDSRYKHDVELVSERVALDNVYFFDAVVGNPQESDKPVSNSSKVVFFGDIFEFVGRLNASLEYANLLKWNDGVDEDGNEIKIPEGYHVVVDGDISTEEKLMSFEDQFFSNVLQEIYNTYEVPYYLVGKTIHIGYANESIDPPTFAYGVDDALLAITKNNANFKVVNRATATGSSDNIPFYYPNNSPKGDVEAVSSNEGVEVKIIDFEKFSDAVEIDNAITFRNAECQLSSFDVANSDFVGLDAWYSKGFYDSRTDEHITLRLDVSSVGRKTIRFGVEAKNIRDYNGEEIENADYSVQWSLRSQPYDPEPIETWMAREASQVIELPNLGINEVYLCATIRFVDAKRASLSSKLHYADLKMSLSLEDNDGWEYKGKMYELEDLGLSISSGNPVSGDTITQRLIRYIKTSQNLMPSIYRESNGDERFYNATNDTYEGVTFNNPYIEGHPKEHIFTVEDIKPTIKEAVNALGLRMDMFSEFAYDLDDSDETVENDNGDRDFVHSYFFGKLRKLDFNLFDHAIENQPMTISFTSGDCGACNFEIGVTEEFPQKNPVQVNEDGTLKRDENGRVICGQFKEITEDECQPQQQDTVNNEVWIALKKEEDTYGILMPKATIYEKDEDGNIVYDENGEAVVKESGHRPKACTDGQNDGDTFVILGINLPQSYITNAEEKLKAEIIKYLQDNNDEKFTFSINFSRIYFEENPDVLDYLNENSRINVVYNGRTYLLYVTSFSYYMGEGDVLPEIRVELDDSLTVSQNALQNAISQVKSDVGRALSNIDVLGMAAPYFLRKDTDDEAQGKINFVKGIKFGEGGKVEVLDNNSAKLTIEYLEVTKKASFTSLEIKEKTHVGGQIIISPAAMTCGEVEELEDVYRCYFQTRDENGSEEIFNQFAVNDLAICQTYNEWGSRYYWRKVVGVGEDYIDLSKTLCDEGSNVPVAGDKIVQLGNTEDTTRQAAQVLSAYGEDAPSFIMYNGINDFSLEGKNITGIIWNPETQEPQMYSYGSFFFGDRQLQDNFITFQKREGDAEKTLSINADIAIGPNSTGLTNLSEWAEKQEQIDAATQGVTLVQQDVQYLKGTFAQSVDVEGVVMSEMVAVKDDAGNVVSFVNGSDIGKDDEHGKLLIAAGIDDITKPEEAKTRVYEDGSMFTKLLSLLEGCRIGNLMVTPTGISAEEGCDSTAGSTRDSARFNEDGFSVYSMYNTGSACVAKRSVDIDAGLVSVFNNPTYDKKAVSFESVDSAIALKALRSKIGLLVGDLTSDEYDALKSMDNNTYSAYAKVGMFGGLRPKTRVISTSTTSRNVLEDVDFSVLVNLTSGTCYIKLPVSPLDGQEYHIESKGATTNVVASHPIYSVYSGNTTPAGTAVSQSGRSLLRFKYYADIQEWTVTWMSRNA